MDANITRSALGQGSIAFLLALSFDEIEWNLRPGGIGHAIAHVGFEAGFSDGRQRGFIQAWIARRLVNHGGGDQAVRAYIDKQDDSPILGRLERIRAMGVRRR